MGKYSYITVASKFNFYSYILEKSLLSYDEEDHSDNQDEILDIVTSDSADWGIPSFLDMDSPDTFPLPIKLMLRWISLTGKICYEINTPLDQAKAEELWKKQQEDFPNEPFKQYIIGIAPHGGVAIWLCNNLKSVLVQWLRAEEVPLNEEEKQIYTPHPERESVINYIMSPEKLQSHMRQHRYRFVPLEEYFDGENWQKYENNDSHYEDIDLDGVEVKRLDGTFDYTGNGDLMRYHTAGKPKRIMVRWHEGDSSFFAHFWLDESVVATLFDSFFNTFPDANADLLLRIDTRAKRFEIALTGEGLPIRTLPFTQYIVAKDFMEFSRSANYSRKDGEWRWSYKNDQDEDEDDDEDEEEEEEEEDEE